MSDAYRTARPSKPTVALRFLVWFFCVAAASGVRAESKQAPQQYPQRIVTLAPHLTEIVFALGAGNRLVGVSSYSDYPPEASKLPVLAESGRPNFELVRRANPDLILAWGSGNRAADLERLRALGYRVHVSDAHRLDEVAASVREIGSLLGRAEAADEIANAYQKEIEALRERYRGKRTLAAFVEIWHEPLMTVNGRHVMSDIMTLCGARNIFAELDAYTPVVSAETLYVRKPDVVLSVAFPDDVSLRAAWARWAGVDAVREGRLYALDSSLLSRMSPRLAKGAASMCEAIDRARSR